MKKFSYCTRIQWASVFHWNRKFKPLVQLVKKRKKCVVEEFSGIHGVEVSQVTRNLRNSTEKPQCKKMRPVREDLKTLLYLVLWRGLRMNTEKQKQFSSWMTTARPMTFCLVWRTSGRSTFDPPYSHWILVSSQPQRGSRKRTVLKKVLIDIVCKWTRK